MIRMDNDGSPIIVLPYKDYTFVRELSISIAHLLQNQKEWDQCTQDDVYNAVELLTALLPSADEYMLLDNVAAGRKTVV